MNTLEVWLDPGGYSTGLEVIGVMEEREEAKSVRRRERVVARWEGKERKVVIPLETGYGGLTAVRVRVIRKRRDLVTRNTTVECDATCVSRW